MYVHLALVRALSLILIRLMSLEIYEVRLRIQTLLSRMRSEAASKDLHATKIAH